ILSVKGVARVQIVQVAILLGILWVFVSFGMPATRHAHFENFMDKGMLKVLATAGIVFVSFGGLTKVASVAEEVRHPGRNIPAGMFASVLVVTLFYVAAVFVTVGVLKPDTLEGSLTPLSLAAKEFLGGPGLILLSLGAMLAFITTANGGIMAASRTPMAMSRDGLLPAAMKKLSGRFATPFVSILVTSGFMIAAIAFLRIEDLVKAASTMMLMLFAMVSLSVIIMRSSGIQNYRPLYKAPFYPWLQIAGIAAYLFLIADMGAVPLLVTLMFVLAGVLWYILYVRTRIAGESAFVYMVKNIVSKDIYRSQLEEELKEIALERDEVTHDRFDRLIKDCEILDLEGPLSAEQLFRRSAEALAPRLNIDEQKLLDLLTRREAESSTVIQPGLAIPHIIVEGRKRFDILPIRCKEGVTFPGHDEPVRVAFILVGSRDERNYHLRALMAIAQIAQEKDFENKWLNARDIEALRNLILLSKRKRDTV
ncbi:MAG: amino acid permease, partial [Thermoplasmata archaeon]|nr:amino acid permease [Thermoplasmata archaeon]